MYFRKYTCASLTLMSLQHQDACSSTSGLGVIQRSVSKLKTDLLTSTGYPSTIAKFLRKSFWMKSVVGRVFKKYNELLLVVQNTCCFKWSFLVRTNWTCSASMTCVSSRASTIFCGITVSSRNLHSRLIKLKLLSTNWQWIAVYLNSVDKKIYLMNNTLSRHQHRDEVIFRTASPL